MQFPAALITFTEEILGGKLHLFVQYKKFYQLWHFHNKPNIVRLQIFFLNLKISLLLTGIVAAEEIRFSEVRLHSCYAE